MNKDDEPTQTVLRICTAYSNAPDMLIEILHDVQAAISHVSETSLKTIASALNITRAEVHGVVSFYEDFKTAAPARHGIKICRGEACQSLGAQVLLDHTVEAVAGRDVDVEAVYCLGNCALGPAAMIGEKLAGRVDQAKLLKIVNGLVK